MIEQRLPDLFATGYGSLWLPPPGRADSGDQSVGYDVYDRFDLGTPHQPTLYGTARGLETLAAGVHQVDASLHLDAVLNHSGFSDRSTLGFVASGGYPGLAITLADDSDGDYHPPSASGDLEGRLSGLVDIDHQKNHPLVRHPVDPDDPLNLPPGTTPDGAGRLANIPDADHRRFYPDADGDAMFLFDPATNESDIAVYSFDTGCPDCGDPVAENAMGYLMRYLQWSVQVVGADGFRIDAAKHVDRFVLDYFDRAVYRSSPRPLLDGSTRHVFSYSEVFADDTDTLLSHVKKSIDPEDVGRIGGNRDVLDFSLFFALRDNLDSTGTALAWQHIRDASVDAADDGLHNGSAGVMFVQSHDELGPGELSNVAHAYVLMHPGNAVVYFNGRQFGEHRDFPKPGRGDALGGVYGGALARLVAIRNTHGRGDYRERWIDGEGLFAYERAGSALVGLSNRGDGGFDQRDVQVELAPGTLLVELTGNASDTSIDPLDDIPAVLTVSDQQTVGLRIPRNRNAEGDFHGSGYVVYGLATPQAPAGLELVGADGVMAGAIPAANDVANGQTRLSDVSVIHGDTFEVRLQTQEVRLLGSDELRDHSADGDNALLKLDGGVDLNGSGAVDFVTPGDVSYGFESFTDKSSPLIGPEGLDGPRGDGEFLQTIDATQLAEGPHFLEARAFRHRSDGGPAVFSSFKQSLYVDRLPPQTAVDSWLPEDDTATTHRDLVGRSIDLTADNMHLFLNLPAGETETEILDRVAAGEGATGRIDRDRFQRGFADVPHGNSVATIVAFEPTGTWNIQRFPGLFADTAIGAGLGDLDFDGQYRVDDVDLFESVLQSQQRDFNPAGDFNSDGLTTYTDLLLFGARLGEVAAGEATTSAWEALHASLFGATDDALSTWQGLALEVPAPGILENDRDPGSDGLLVLTTLGAHETDLGGQATLAADGGFDYIPPSHLESLPLGQVAFDQVDYAVDDGHGNTDTATIVIRVEGLNDPPSAADDSFTLRENSVLTVPPLGLLENDQDIDADPLLVTLEDGPPRGSIEVSEDGSFEYTPNQNDNRTVAFSYLAIDPHEASSQAVVKLFFETDYPWHNGAFPLDVNDDGHVAPNDALRSVSAINRFSSRLLPTERAEGVEAPCYDVNRDGFHSAIDVLQIVNAINSQIAQGEGEARRGAALPWSREEANTPRQLLARPPSAATEAPSDHHGFTTAPHSQPSAAMLPNRIHLMDFAALNSPLASVREFLDALDALFALDGDPLSD